MILAIMEDVLPNNVLLVRYMASTLGYTFSRLCLSKTLSHKICTLKQGLGMCCFDRTRATEPYCFGTT